MSTTATRFAQVMAEAQEISAKAAGQAMDAETRTKFESLIIEGETLRTQMEQDERLIKLAGWAGESKGRLPIAGKSEESQARVAGWNPQTGQTTVEAKDGKLQIVNEFGEGLIDAKTLQLITSSEYKSAFRTYLRKGVHGLSSVEIKTLSEGTDSAGGFTVPEEIMNMIISKLPTPTRIQGRVTQFTVSRDRVMIPRVNYSTDDLYATGMRVTWTGEIPASATTHRVTDPVFGQTAIDIHTALMSMPLTRDLVEDSAFPLMSYVGQKFQETALLTKDNMILNGTGVGQPAGILRNPNATDEPATVVTGAAAAMTWDGILDLFHAVPEQYDENGAFVFNKTSTAAALSKLKDGDGRPLWSMGVGDTGLAADIRNRPLLGVPVLLSGFMPSVAANAYPIIYGDLSGYYMANRIGFSLQVLNELYAETNQILFLGRMRIGGITAEPFRLKIQKVST